MANKKIGPWFRKDKLFILMASYNATNFDTEFVITEIYTNTIQYNPNNLDTEFTGLIPAESYTTYQYNSSNFDTEFAA